MKTKKTIDTIRICSCTKTIEVQKLPCPIEPPDICQTLRVEGFDAYHWNSRDPETDKKDYLLIADDPLTPSFAHFVWTDPLGLTMEYLVPGNGLVVRAGKRYDYIEPAHGIKDIARRVRWVTAPADKTHSVARKLMQWGRPERRQELVRWVMENSVPATGKSPAESSDLAKSRTGRRRSAAPTRA